MIQNFVIESHELLISPTPTPSPSACLGAVEIQIFIRHSRAAHCNFVHSRARARARIRIRLRLEAMCRELRGNLILYRRCFFQLHKARSNAIGLLGEGEGTELPTHTQTDRQGDRLSPHSIRLGAFRTVPNWNC